MKDRRKTTIVDQKFQYRLASNLVLAAVIAANSAIMLAYHFFPYELNAVLGPFTWAIGLFELLLVSTIFYLGARASRRIAGPAYALKRDLRRLGDGDLSTRTRFRQGDYLHDVADAFNENVQRLAQRLDALRRVAESLRVGLPEGSASREQAEQLVAELLAMTARPIEVPHPGTVSEHPPVSIHSTETARATSG